MMEEMTSNQSPPPRNGIADQMKIRTAVNLACACIPYLAGLAAKANIQLDDRIETACVFGSGRMLVSPEFFDSLNCEELAFVLAHEFMHLFLQTAQRRGSSTDFRLINIAHDLIINEMVGKAFDRSDSPPGEGLDWRSYQKDFEKKYPGQIWKPAAEYSLEELVQTLRPLQDKIRNCWKLNKTTQRPEPKRSSTLGDLLAEAGIQVDKHEEEQIRSVDSSTPQRSLDDLLGECGDVLTLEIEMSLFPDMTQQSVEDLIKEILQTVARCAAEQQVQIRLKNITEHFPGTGTGDSENSYSLLRGQYRTPWEAALQRWFDATAPGERSWARPSRRGAFRTDVVLPGRKREGWTIHIVLDTSGSMSDELSEALGAIDQFCQVNGVESVHILQCDTEVTCDEYVELGDLEHFQAKGFGGSDMSPAMLRLAEDPDVEAVIVLTDGWIDYPAEPMPYETLWCITSGYEPDFPYGSIVQIPCNN